MGFASPESTCAKREEEKDLFLHPPAHHCGLPVTASVYFLQEEDLEAKQGVQVFVISKCCNQVEIQVFPFLLKDFTVLLPPEVIFGS